MCCRPEENCTETVERKTHENGDLVTLSLHNLSGNGGEEEVTATKVDDLKASRLELCDLEDSLEMLVEDIEETITETPEEEEGDDEGERKYQCLSSQETRSEGRSGDRNSASHCERLFWAGGW